MCQDFDLPHVPFVDPPPGSTVFVNVDVFDGLTNGVARDAKVLVIGDRIERVFQGELEGDPDHLVIDGGGRMLMAGELMAMTGKDSLPG